MNARNPEVNITVRVVDVLTFGSRMLNLLIDLHRLESCGTEEELKEKCLTAVRRVGEVMRSGTPLIEDMLRQVAEVADLENQL